MKILELFSVAAIGHHRPGVRIDFRSFADDGIVVVMFDLDTVIEGTESVKED